MEHLPIVYEMFPELVGGKDTSHLPPKNILTEHDATDESVEQLPIRNRGAYDKAKANLLEALEKLTVPKIPQPDDRKNTNRGNVIGTIGRTMTFGFGDNRRGFNYFKTNAKYPEIYKALVEFGNRAVPKGWEYQAITLNHGVKAKKHIDSKNVGKSVIIGIGNFTGGEIGVWRSDNTKPVYKNLHDKPIMFNGGLLPHETQPFEGNRYTMVFYKQGRKPRSGKIGVGAGTATPGNPEGMGSGAIFA